MIDLVADEFVGIDGEIYFVDDTALLDGLAAGDRVSFTYEHDDNGEPVIPTIEVASDELVDASGTNDDLGTDTGDPNDGASTEDGGDGVNSGESDDGSEVAGGDDGSESGRSSAAGRSAQRRGFRAYNVLRYRVLPKAPDAARPALLRTIQRLADRLGLIVDFSGDAAVGGNRCAGSCRAGFGCGKSEARREIRRQAR